MFFLLLVLAAARTLYLGRSAAPALRQAAETQQLSTETVPAQRGTITDRNGVDLAVSEPAQEISADPYLIKEPLQASQQLAPLLGLTQTQLLSKLSEHTGFVVLAPALAARQARKVMARVTALKLEGITGTPTMRRVYPRGTLAAQVLGVVGAEGKGLWVGVLAKLAARRARRAAAGGQRCDRPADLDQRTTPPRSPVRSSR